MSESQDAADAAVDDVIAGLSTDDGSAATGEPSGGEAEAPDATDVEQRPDADLSPTEDDDVEVPMCTETEARELTKQLQEALETFDNTLSQILRRRAWQALGYASPAAYVKAELGPRSDGNNASRYSRSHAFRLARMAMFVYALAEGAGTEEVFSLDIAERPFRRIPASEDEVVLERSVDALRELPDEAYEDGTARDVVGQVMSDAASEYEERGSLRRDSEDEWSAGSDTDIDPADLDGLDAVNADADGWSPDEDDPKGTPQSVEGDGSGGADGEEDAGGEGDEEAQPSTSVHEQGSTDLASLVNAHSLESAPEGALEAAEALRTFLVAFRAIEKVSPQLPELLDYADDDELADLIESLQKIDPLVQETLAAAEERY